MKEKKTPAKIPNSQRKLLSRAKRLEVMKLLAMGASRRDVASLLKIHHVTIANEMERDEKFKRMVEFAESECKLKCLKKILNDKSWQASAWYLERKFYSEYGKTPETTATNEIGDMVLRILTARDITKE